jgi:hypothetical protein
VDFYYLTSYLLSFAICLAAYANRRICRLTTLPTFLWFLDEGELASLPFSFVQWDENQVHPFFESSPMPPSLLQLPPEVVPVVLVLGMVGLWRVGVLGDRTENNGFSDSSFLSHRFSHFCVSFCTGY